jgi:hypothetical protein
MRTSKKDELRRRNGKDKEDIAGEKRRMMKHDKQRTGEEEKSAEEMRRMMRHDKRRRAVKEEIAGEKD